MSDKNTVLSFETIAGEKINAEVAVNTELKVIYPNGEEKIIKLTKAAPRARVDINDMTIDELRLEIRNSGSVYSKANKKFKELSEEDQVKFDTTKLTEQKARFDAATELFEKKFPGQSKTVGGKGTGRSNKSNKVDKIAEIIATIKESALPDAQKAEALSKLDVLLGALTPKKKDEDKKETAPKAEVKEEVKSETKVAEAKSADIPEAAKPARVARR